MRNFIDLITKTFIAEARRGLASIGELRAKVFWNPRRPDMIQALAKSKIGDLRGSWLQTESETMWAIWPARVLGHWNFHNECAAREGIAAQTNIDFRVCRDLSILNEERYWSKATHYEGDGFYCAFFPETDISTIPELHMLFGELTPTERLAVEEADIGTRFPKASARISYDDGESEADVFVKPSVGTILKCIGNYDARALIYEDGTLVIWEQGDMYHQDVYDNPITKRPDDFLLLKLQPPGKFDAGVGVKGGDEEPEPFTDEKWLRVFHSNRALVAIYGNDFPVETYNWW